MLSLKFFFELFLTIILLPLNKFPFIHISILYVLLSVNASVCMSFIKKNFFEKDIRKGFKDLLLPLHYTMNSDQSFTMYIPEDIKSRNNSRDVLFFRF